MKKKLPKKVHTVAEERAFWETNSVADHLEELEIVNVTFPKPKHIIVDLTTTQLTRLKKLAAKKRIPYSRLVQKWISEKLSHA